MLNQAREENRQLARKFYQIDRNLSTEDRTKLAGVFSKEMILLPLGSLPFVILGIQFPRLAAQRKLMFQKSFRGWQVVFGFAGLVIGSRASAKFWYWYGKTSFDEGSNAQRAYEMLGKYPSQLGRTYFEQSAKNPEWLMPDPDAPTTKPNNPAGFPLSLVLHRHVRQGMGGSRSRMGPPSPKTAGYEQEQEQQQDYQQPPSGEDSYQAQSSSSEDPFALSTPTEAISNNSSTTSTWDKIRAQNGITSRGTSGTAPIPPMGQYRPPPRDHRDRASEEPVRGEIIPIVPAESQTEFDKELERERQGGGVVDDFSDSERKWS